MAGTIAIDARCAFMAGLVQRKRNVILGFTAMSLMVGRMALPQSPSYYEGEVLMLEAWRSGNVAFTLSASGVPCNGQFILNRSDDGTKNLYALLVAAKTAGKTVRAYFIGCGAAEGAPSSNYAMVNYLYLN